MKNIKTRTIELFNIGKLKLSDADFYNMNRGFIFICNDGKLIDIQCEVQDVHGM